MPDQSWICGQSIRKNPIRKKCSTAIWMNSSRPVSNKGAGIRWAIHRVFWIKPIKPPIASWPAIHSASDTSSIRVVGNSYAYLAAFGPLADQSESCSPTQRQLWRCIPSSAARNRCRNILQSIRNVHHPSRKGQNIQHVEELAHFIRVRVNALPNLVAGSVCHL